jgi:hypothetical protein
MVPGNLPGTHINWLADSSKLKLSASSLREINISLLHRKTCRALTYVRGPSKGCSRVGRAEGFWRSVSKDGS